jgi:hypothetical protein
MRKKAGLPLQAASRALPLPAAFSLPETKRAVQCEYKKLFNLRCDLRNGQKAEMSVFSSDYRLHFESGREFLSSTAAPCWRS